MLDSTLSLPGNVASIAGLGLSLYTLYRVILTERAAKASVKQTAAALDRVGVLVLHEQVGRASQLLAALRESCTQGDWSLGRDQLARLRPLLARFIDNPRVPQDAQKLLVAAISDLGLLAGRIELYRRRSTSGPVPPKMLASLDATDIVCSRIAGRLLGATLEDQA